MAGWTSNVGKGVSGSTVSSSKVDGVGGANPFGDVGEDCEVDREEAVTGCGEIKDMRPAAENVADRRCFAFRLRNAWISMLPPPSARVRLTSFDLKESAFIFCSADGAGVNGGVIRIEPIN